MSTAILEHINLTVKNPTKTANMLIDLFGWHIRWQGEALSGGFTIHVGGENSYLALYNHNSADKSDSDSHYQVNGLNHLGIVVDDLEATERKILDAGFKTHNHGDYEPGQRFYFYSHDDLEIEVISYQ